MIPIPIFPQQRKLIGSSAQNSSGVHWCRRRVRFNEVPEKLPGDFGAQQGSGEGSEEGLGGFGAEPGQVQQGSKEGSGEGWEALVQSQVRFNRVPEKVPEKVWFRARPGSTGLQRRFRRRLGGFGAEPGQVQQGSGEGSGEGLGGFGSEPGQVQQGSKEGSGEGWEALVQSQVRFNRVPEKVPEKVWEALVQSQARFNRAPKKVPEKVGRLWCRARSGSTGFRRRFRRRSGRLWFRARPGSTGLQRRFRRRSGREKVPEKVGRLWCRARSGSTGFRRRFRRRFGRLWSTLRCFQRFASQHTSERFVKIKRCGCWGYHRSLLCLLKWGFAQAPDSSAIFLIKSLRIIVFFQISKETPHCGSIFERLVRH